MTDFSLGRTQHVPRSACISCGHKMDRAKSVSADGDDHRPNPGDVTVCIRCGHLMVYADDLTLRNPTDTEIVKIAGDPRILAIQRARAAVRNNLNPMIARLDMPDRMRGLPVDARGYPVPRFVATVNGVPDFRCVDTTFYNSAVRLRLCWLCGQRLGRHMAFVIGPMCAINRVSSEPPSHLDCARFAVKACPFLTQPHRRRNDQDLPDQRRNPAGVMIERNPGVTLIWVADSYRIFRNQAGVGEAGVLFTFGDPSLLEWYAHGRTATRDEIMASIDSGLPALRAVAERQGGAALAEFDNMVKRGLALVPKEDAHAHQGHPGR